MDNITLHYVGQITVKSVRDFVMDNKLTDNDTVFLGYGDFEDLSKEYHQTYRQRLPDPYIVFDTVLVEQDILGRIPVGRIGCMRNDTRRPGQIRNKEDLRQSLLNSEMIIYRCVRCGDIVDANGDELDITTYGYHRQILETRKAKGFVRTIQSYCCTSQNSGDENESPEKFDD
jgi:hypothetical protein